MKHLLMELNDLPDKILMIIFKKLYEVEVLHSLIGVNNRLNTIARDRIFTSHLTLLQYSSNGSINPLPPSMLDRFCLQILPYIHRKIQWLDLESTSIERILHATTYPNLYRLGLCDIDVEAAMSLFIGETPLACLFKNRISSLSINFVNKKNDMHMLMPIFTQIFTMFTNLRCLNFNLSSFRYERLSFDISHPTVSSLTLLELHVNLRSFGDCLYLLDGRFDQLREVHVNIFAISSRRLTINNKEKLPQLRVFSLHCDKNTDDYDELIPPLLHRMLNLEELDLHLVADRRKGFIDGNELKKKIVNHMPRLNKFTFNIRSIIYLHNQINLPSNEDIQNTFGYLNDNQIISCVDSFEEKHYSQCHIYSYPYKLKLYKNITNNFPGGLFKYVTQVSLYDDRPFEHDFFLRIAQSFTFMKDLTIINHKAQNDKRDLSIIEYPHLTILNLREAHDDYVEQFLVDTKMCMPNNVSLFIDYHSLDRVTHSFTRNTTRINCEKLGFLYVH